MNYSMMKIIISTSYFNKLKNYIFQVEQNFSYLFIHFVFYFIYQLTYYYFLILNQTLILQFLNPKLYLNLQPCFNYSQYKLFINQDLLFKYLIFSLHNHLCNLPCHLSVSIFHFFILSTLYYLLICVLLLCLFLILLCNHSLQQILNILRLNSSYFIVYILILHPILIGNFIISYAFLEKSLHPMHYLHSLSLQSLLLAMEIKVAYPLIILNLIFINLLLY